MYKFLLLLASSSTASEFCKNFTPFWTVLGYIIFGIKIIVPLILIITGMVTFVKALGKNDEKMENVKGVLFKKVGYAVAVFVVITLVSMIVNIVSKDSYYEKCAKCTFSPFDDGCEVFNVDLSINR